MAESTNSQSLYTLLAQTAPPRPATEEGSGSPTQNPDERPKPQPTTLTFTLESVDYDSSAAAIFVGLDR